MTAKIELDLEESRTTIIALQMFSDAQKFMAHKVMQRGGVDSFTQAENIKKLAKVIQKKIYEAGDANGLVIGELVGFPPKTFKK